MWGNRARKIGECINDWRIVGIKKGHSDALIYTCVCPWGHLSDKSHTAFKQSAFCSRCPKQPRKPRKTKQAIPIGSKISIFTVIGHDRSKKNRVKYIAKCTCGTLLTATGDNLKRISGCKNCYIVRKGQQKIGKVIGIYSVIGRESILEKGKNARYRCICNLCKAETLVTNGALKSAKYCSACHKGYYPGKKINNITLLSRKGKGLWECCCDCGIAMTKTVAKILKSKNPCICLQRKSRLEAAQKKLGLKYANLRIVGIDSYTNGHIKLRVLCSCGNTIIRNNGNEFKSKSCGCRWHGHMIGEKCHFSKMTGVEAASLKELYATGLYTIKNLQEMFSISRSQILNIVQRKMWKHLS